MEGKDSLNLSLGLNSYGDGEGSSTSEPVMPSGIHRHSFTCNFLSFKTFNYHFELIILCYFECKNDKDMAGIGVISLLSRTYKKYL